MKTYTFFVGLEQLHKIEIACAIHFCSMKRHLSFAYSDRDKDWLLQFCLSNTLFVTGYGYPLNLPEVDKIIHHLSKKNLGKFYYNYSSGKTPPPALEGESVPEYNKLHMRATAP